MNAPEQRAWTWRGSQSRPPLWSVVLPVAAALVFMAAATLHIAPLVLGLLLFAGLGVSIASAVHHAEVIAHRVGEPFGTLVLALAVTVIEVALIVTVMLEGGAAKSALARDTVFAAVMIVCNGTVGLCLVAGGIAHRLTTFRIEGTRSALAVLVALATLTLVLPVFTTTTSGPTFSPAQLLFAGTLSLVLYAVFVFVQTVSHREFFLPVEHAQAHRIKTYTPVPGRMQTILSVVFLLVSLSLVVLLGAPPAATGIAIALLVLMPESWAALRAARANRMQISLNLAIGSALASISLTIPVVACVSLFLGVPLVLGLEPRDMVLLALTFVVSALTLGSGRSTVLQGAVHLVIFAAFLFLALVP
jgi:Ca2+:H+ antiporter